MDLPASIWRAVVASSTCHPAKTWLIACDVARRKTKGGERENEGEKHATPSKDSRPVEKGLLKACFKKAARKEKKRGPEKILNRDRSLNQMPGEASNNDGNNEKKEETDVSVIEGERRRKLTTERTSGGG